MPIEQKKALIVVRTYPTPARKGIEVSCTAAITDSGQWLRLFPVPYRFLAPDQRFRKYQWVNVAVEKASDSRPESYKLTPDGIRIESDPLPTDGDWVARKRVVYPLKKHCLCCLKAERDSQGYPTLGFFRPKTIKRLVIEPDSPEWTNDQLAILRQQNLFGEQPQEELEKVPFNFRYEFECNHPGCRGHALTCVDWELGQSWRSWRDAYGPGWESKFRQRYEQEMIEKYDTHFYVGTVRQHPASWIIVGLFYPPKQPPGLFNGEA
jgi:hypothetical protein